LQQVEFKRLDPFYKGRFPEHEVTANADLLRYEEALVGQFPAEIVGIRQLFDAMQHVFFEFRRFITDSTSNRLPPMMELPTRYPKMLAAMRQSWGDFMGQYVQDAKLKGIISVFWLYCGLPPSQLNAAAFIVPWVSYHLFGAYYPVGGSMAMSRALEATIKKYGGEVRYRQTVTAIDIVDGLATTVTTEKGERFSADVIISNANAPDTMLKMVGAAHLPQRYVWQLSDALTKPSLSSVIVFLGIDQSKLDAAWPLHEMFVSDTYDIEGDYRATLNGRFEQIGMMISHYAESDPTAAPDGCSVLTIMVLAPWEYADQWGTNGELNRYGKNPRYLALKEAVGDTLIDRVDAIIPGLRRAIKFVEVSTPLTNYRYSLNPSGSIYGSQMSVDNMYMNRLGEETPIPNLLLTGAWVNSGGMSSALFSGRTVARRASAYLDAAPATEAVIANFTPAQPGQMLPALTFRPMGSQRESGFFGVDGLMSRSERPLVLVCYTPDSSAECLALIQTLRTRYPAADDLLLVSVVDLHKLPKAFHKFAEREMQTVYDALVNNMPPEAALQEYAVILLDWAGHITRAIGLQDVDEHAAVVVADHNGQLIGSQQGENLPAAVYAMLQTVENRFSERA
jgi:prolycopene isomerase